jgi:Zn-dependent dipeptidase, microsomal dipeptidase homolog
VRAALDAAGTDHVAIGSDMDGALRMLIDVEGLPALADALLESGLDEPAVAAVMGGNAVTMLRGTLS